MAATARSASDDLYQNHRFQVTDTQGVLAGGFNFCSAPEITVDMVEYREGVWTFTRKQGVRPHFQTVSLHQGIALQDSAFYKWMLAFYTGKTYRTNIIISQFHRTDVAGLVSYANSTPSRQWQLFNCTPSRFRPGSDNDSQSADVSIQEIDVDPEYVKLFVNGQEITA